jgi:hypothetical protein
VVKVTSCVFHQAITFWSSKKSDSHLVRPGRNHRDVAQATSTVSALLGESEKELLACFDPMSTEIARSNLSDDLHETECDRNFSFSDEKKG